MAALRRRDVSYIRRTQPGLVIVTCLVFTAIAGIAIGFSALWAGSTTSDQYTAADARASMVHEVNSHNAAGRKAAAQAILWLDSQSNGDTHLIAGSDSDEQDSIVHKQLHAAAATGQPLSLDAKHVDYWPFWRTHWLLFSLLPLIPIYMAAGFFVYAFETLDREEYLMDLPWRRVWPVFFVAFTALPFGWLCYIVSAFTTHYARKHQPPEQRVEANVPAAQQPAPPQEFVFHAAPGIAKELYVQLRSGFWAERLATQRERISDELRAVNARLRELGEELKDEQRRRGSFMAQQRELESIKPNEELEAGHIEKEFEQLLALPGVEGARVVGGSEISLFVKVRPTFGGRKYDFGDWELRFGGSSTGLSTRRIRSGVRSDWGNQYPVYGSSSFCFGQRQYIINEHMSKGQFLQAVDIAIDSMHSINPEHQNDLPRAYRLAEV